MATIAEIIAAKKAGAAAASAAGKPVTYAAAPAPKESIAQRLETEEAMNRIDPPGKSAAVAAARKSAGLILNKDMPVAPKGEPRGQATAITGPPEDRSLSRPEGEAVPLVPTTADREEATWHEALNSFESSLCVMRDPKEADVIWLAVRAERDGLPPILLHRLPWLLWDYPTHPKPEGSPF